MMIKRTAFLLLFVMVIPSLKAQNKIKVQDISISYIAPMAIRDPGVKIGLGLSFRNWKHSKTNRKGDSKTINHQIYFEPQLAYFGTTNYYYSFLSNIETGWKWQREGWRSHSRLGLGLGFNNRSEVLTLTANFDGTNSVAESENRAYFMPSLSYQWAYSTYKHLDLFTKASAGINFSSSHPNFKTLLVEFGLRYNFFSTNTKSYNHES